MAAAGRERDRRMSPQALGFGWVPLRVRVRAGASAWIRRHSPRGRARARTIGGVRGGGVVSMCIYSTPGKTTVHGALVAFRFGFELRCGLCDARSIRPDFPAPPSLPLSASQAKEAMNTLEILGSLLSMCVGVNCGGI